MEEKLLSSVDSVRFMQTSGWNFNKHWSGRVDVSVWLRANVSPNGRLYLFLVYQDQESRHAIPIDRCAASSGDSILLNGRIHLSGRGRLKSMQVKLKLAGCDSSLVFIEDLSVRAHSITKAGPVSEAV